MKKLIFVSFGVILLLAGCNLQNGESDDAEQKQIKELQEQVKKLENSLAEEQGEEKNVAEDGTKAEEEEKTLYEGPNFIKLTSPKNNAGVSKQPVIFSGEVSPNTEKIVVTAKSEGPDGPVELNVYQLQSFKEGDKTFTYRAKLDFENIKVGQNYYEFKAFFNDGTTKIEELTINFYVGENNITLNQPVSNDRYAVKPIEFKGTVSPNTTKIVAKAWRVAGTYGEFEYDGYQDVYTLQNFKTGDSSFVYKASTDFNNLFIGPNNYDFTAYFDDETRKTVSVSNIWFAP